MGTTTEADAEDRSDRGSKAEQGGAAARALARILWEHDFDATYPTATPEDKQASWVDARQQYVRLGRTVLQRLHRRGFTIDATGATEGEPE